MNIILRFHRRISPQWKRKIKKIIVTAQANWFLWMFGRISSQTSIKATPAEQ
jgi:hypothetical protein